MKNKDILSFDDLARLVDAIRKLQKKINWKTGKDIIHLNKRQQMGHLSLSASMLEYEKIIFEIIKDERNAFYLYEVKGLLYYAVQGIAQDQEWLIIFGEGGLMETAFPPVDMDGYLERRGFILLGRIEEVLEWKN